MRIMWTNIDSIKQIQKNQTCLKDIFVSYRSKILKLFCLKKMYTVSRADDILMKPFDEILSLLQCLVIFPKDISWIFESFQDVWTGLKFSAFMYLNAVQILDNLWESIVDEFAHDIGEN